MSGSSWFDYVNRRYTALLNLNKMLEARGLYVDTTTFPFFKPENLLDFRLKWGDTTLVRERKEQEVQVTLGSLGQFIETETVKPEPQSKYEVIPQNEVNRTQIRFATLLRDREGITIYFPQTGETVVIAFISPPATSQKVTKTKMAEDFLPLLLEVVGVEEFQQTQVIMNIHAIMITDDPIAGDARKYLANLNRVFKGGLQHFTITELQCNKLDHITQPKNVRKLSDGEIQRWIDSQKGLVIGRRRIATNYEARKESLESESDKRKFDKGMDEEILSKLPLLNSTDPIVKWRGFRVGDILRIERRFGQSKVVFKRVILNINEIK